MDIKWKVLNFIFVLMPKVLIWAGMLLAGTIFLMETQGIDNIVVNSTALGFVLCIDELFFELLTSDTCKKILQRIEAFPLFDLQYEEDMEDDAVLVRHMEKTMACSCFASVKAWSNMLPINLVLASGLWIGVMAYYYGTRCQLTEDGIWVSRSMYLPKGVGLTLFQAMLPTLFRPQTEDEPYWTMPDRQEN